MRFYFRFLNRNQTNLKSFRYIYDVRKAIAIGYSRGRSLANWERESRTGGKRERANRMRGKVAGESVENKPLRRKVSPHNSLSRALDANAFGGSSLSLSPAHTHSLSLSLNGSFSLSLSFLHLRRTFSHPHSRYQRTPEEKCEKLYGQGLCSYVYKYVKCGENREMHQNSVFSFCFMSV